MLGDTVTFIVADHNLVFSLFRVLYEHVFISLFRVVVSSIFCIVFWTFLFTAFTCTFHLKAVNRVLSVE